MVDFAHVFNAILALIGVIILMVGTVAYAKATRRGQSFVGDKATLEAAVEQRDFWKQTATDLTARLSAVESKLAGLEGSYAQAVSERDQLREQVKSLVSPEMKGYLDVIQSNHELLVTNEDSFAALLENGKQVLAAILALAAEMNMFTAKLSDCPAIKARPRVRKPKAEPAS